MPSFLIVLRSTLTLISCRLGDIRGPGLFTFCERLECITTRRTTHVVSGVWVHQTLVAEIVPTISYFLIILGSCKSLIMLHPIRSTVIVIHFMLFHIHRHSTKLFTYHYGSFSRETQIILQPGQTLNLLAFYDKRVHHCKCGVRTLLGFPLPPYYGSQDITTDNSSYSLLDTSVYIVLVAYRLRR